MIKKIFTYSILTILILPSLVFAQMTSENFVVEGPAVGSGAVSGNDTSTNYDADVEVGGLYQIDVTAPVTPTPVTPAQSGSITGTKIQKKNQNSPIATALLIGPATASEGGTVTLALDTKDPALVGAAVLFQVSGANDISPIAVDLGDGLYTATYVATNNGNDVVTASINGVLVTTDTDGNSNGKLNIKVRKNTPAVIPEVIIPEEVATTTEELIFDSGITAACNRAFTWDEAVAVTVKRTIGQGIEEKLATIGAKMPWFIDTEMLTEQNVTYTLTNARGKSGTKTFAPIDFVSCQEDVAAVITLDVDSDQASEQYIEGIFQDIDGSSQPYSLTADGVVLDTNNDESPDLFWNPELGTSTVIAATDRLFIVDKSVAPTQAYIPIVRGSYKVVLAPRIDGGVVPTPVTPTLEPLQSAPLATGEAPILNFEKIELLALASPWAYVIAVVGLAGGLVTTLFRVVGTPFSVTSFARIFAHGGRFIFGSLVFWKRKRAWGTIYDSATKAPIDPAYVELFDTQGEKHAEAITDLDGRYGFLVPEGEYELKVRKVNYAFPSTHHVVTGHDVLYDNLYYGGPMHVTAEVTYDVPMDPLAFDWNQHEKMHTGKTRFIHRFDPFVARALNVFFYIGVIALIWQFVATPDVITGALLAFYVFLLIARFVGGGPTLYGTLRRSGEPVAFAVVRVMRNQREVLSRVTDAYGRYAAIVPPGTYVLQVQELRGQEEYVTVFEREITTKQGVINKNVSI